MLEAGCDSGEIRPVEPLFLVPSMLGCCAFFFLAAPVLRRLFEVERVTPELASRYADHVARLVMRGIAAPDRSSA